jgi:hypothetical protein
MCLVPSPSNLVSISFCFSLLLMVWCEVGELLFLLWLICLVPSPSNLVSISFCFSLLLMVWCEVGELLFLLWLMSLLIITVQLSGNFLKDYTSIYMYMISFAKCYRFIIYPLTNIYDIYYSTVYLLSIPSCYYFHI